MPYTIRFLDDEGVLERKKALRPDHLAYVTANTHRIIASGGIFPDDDDFPIGGLIILDTEIRQEAVDYIENDPFFLHGIFTRYTVDRFKKFVFDGRRVAP